MRATAAILCDLGCPAELAPAMAQKMKESGIVFLSAPLANAIAELVDHHPGSAKAEEEAPG